MLGREAHSGVASPPPSLVPVAHTARISRATRRKYPTPTLSASTGRALLAIPFLFNASLWPPITAAGSLNMPQGAWGKLALCLYAGAIAALTSCSLFGSYLAVSLAFNGHNNEAGRAARIEGFKHFIRFRINREGLTGYVIAIDRAGTEGGSGKLRPKIVDVFHVREG